MRHSSRSTEDLIFRNTTVSIVLAPCWASVARGLGISRVIFSRPRALPERADDDDDDDETAKCEPPGAMDESEEGNAGFSHCCCNGRSWYHVARHFANLGFDPQLFDPVGNLVTS